jgi:hypothetical protein
MPLSPQEYRIRAKALYLQDAERYTIYKNSIISDFDKYMKGNKCQVVKKDVFRIQQIQKPVIISFN